MVAQKTGSEDILVVSFKEFLEKIPPGTFAQVSDLGGGRILVGSNVMSRVSPPEILLHCEGADCGGIRLFGTDFSEDTMMSQNQKRFVAYTCKNCSKISKLFALWFTISDDGKTATTYKFGEYPAFGPPTPARVISLIGPQKDLFLKGRRAENQGMGIAAFAYYRRVIEDQKDRIFDEVIRVCNRLSVDQPIIDELTKAKSETQFTTAVEAMKHAVPQALFINGRNPLTLLHSALSEGLHAQTDEECLEVATSIRVVMAEFAERMGQALKEEAELNAAVSRLLQRKRPVALASPPGSPEAIEPN